MKILSILGSPRSSGNTASIVRRFTEIALELGAENRIFELNQLCYRGCQACYACKKEVDHCILNDDLTQVLDAVHEADLLLLSSPVYFGDVTSQLKGFIDRSYSFLKPNYMTSREPSRLAPKRLVFVLCQGHPDESMFADIFVRYEGFLKWMGFTDMRLIRACGYGPMTVDAIPERILKQTEVLARELVA